MSSESEGSGLSAADRQTLRRLAEVFDGDDIDVLASIVEDRKDNSLSRRAAIAAGLGAAGVGAYGAGSLLSQPAGAASTTDDTVGVAGDEMDFVADELRDAGGDVVLDVDDTGDLDWQGRGFDNVGPLATDTLVIGGTLYEEDGNSPINQSATSSFQYTVSGDYNEVLILIEDGEKLNGFDQLQVNGDTGSNYDSVDNSDTETTGQTEWPKPFDSRLSRFEIRDRSVQVGVRMVLSRSSTGAMVAGSNANLGGSGINTFTLSDSGSSNRSMKARVYGRVMDL